VFKSTPLKGVDTEQVEHDVAEIKIPWTSSSRLLGSKDPDPRSKRLEPRSSGLSHTTNVAFNPLLLAPI
jgi:hypothetical protein